LNHGPAGAGSHELSPQGPLDERAERGDVLSETGWRPLRDVSPIAQTPRTQPATVV
jgi:hypothetical protein